VGRELAVVILLKLVVLRIITVAVDRIIVECRTVASRPIVLVLLVTLVEPSTALLVQLVSVALNMAIAAIPRLTAKWVVNQLMEVVQYCRLLRKQTVDRPVKVISLVESVSVVPNMVIVGIPQSIVEWAVNQRMETVLLRLNPIVDHPAWVNSLVE
jgi:hypothetical protein